jgi:hypothetical protein
VVVNGGEQWWFLVVGTMVNVLIDDGEKLMLKIL